MRYSYGSNRLASDFASDRALRCEYGADRAKKISQRLGQIRAAESIDDLRPPMPGKLHALHGDYDGHYAFHLDGNWRLILRPADEDEEDECDVVITDVIDYH